MVNVPVIAKRELNAYFLSPIAYVVLTGFALTHGIMFAIFVIPSPMSPAKDPNVIAVSCFWTVLYLLILAAPIITMRLLSEETSSGTIEPLMTSPVQEVEVVLGKYCGALIFSVIMGFPLVLEIGFLALAGTVDYGPLAAGFLGLFLLTGQFLAVGLFCSSLTRAQIASAIVSFVLLLGAFFLWFLVRDKTLPIARALQYLAPPMHFSSFTNGILDTRDLVYFAATTVFFLYLTVRVVEMRKWR